MRWRRISNAWNEAFFKPQSPVPLGLYRILFGLLVAAKLILLAPDWLAWFGPQAWVTAATMHRMEGGMRIDLFDVLPNTNAWMWTFFWIALIAAMSFSVGFLTRISAVLVFFALVSMDERELYMMNSGDTFLRIAAFWMMFAPSDAAFSVDRLIRIWRGKETPEHKPQIVWSQRMIQFQTTLVYFVTAWWKATGATWVDGTAIYYVQHLEQFRRFPVPAIFSTPLMVKFQTWFGLAEEFALGTLVWIVELRYWVLAAAVVLHLSLEYTMNVPLFQWIMLSAFILFIPAEDLRRAWLWFCRRLLRIDSGPKLELVYNAANFEIRRRVFLMQSLDIFGRITVIPERQGDWCLRTPEGSISGPSALPRTLWLSPFLAGFTPFIGRKYVKPQAAPKSMQKVK